jgi:ketosteroid isomerase-like protein
MDFLAFCSWSLICKFSCGGLLLSNSSLDRYNAVMNSWALLFNWGQDGGQGTDFQLRDVRARVLSDVAWVNMKVHVDGEPGPLHATNVYEFRNDRWYMVHHHSSVMVDPAPHNLFG